MTTTRNTDRQMRTCPICPDCIADAKLEQPAAVTDVAPLVKAMQLLAAQRGREKTGQKIDAIHHQIYYYKGPISRRIPPIDKLRPVNLKEALKYVLDLEPGDPTYKNPLDAWIVFYNQYTLESFQIIRNRMDVWDLSLPVYELDSKMCHTHRCQTDTEQIQEIVTRFFEGGRWRDVKKIEFDQELYDLNLKFS